MLLAFIYANDIMVHSGEPGRDRILDACVDPLTTRPSPIFIRHSRMNLLQMNEILQFVRKGWITRRHILSLTFQNNVTCNLDFIIILI